MKKTLYLLLMTLLVICCTQKNNNQLGNHYIKKIEINPQINDTILLSNLIENCREIKLKTQQEDLIGEISQVLISDYRIVIRDQIAKIVWVFHKDGSLDYKLDKCGNGPGEFSSVDYINITEEKQMLQIFDRQRNKVLYYNLKNGNYQYSKSNSFAFFSLVNSDNNYLVHTNKKINFDFSKDKYKPDTLNYNLYVLDSNFVCKQKWHPFRLKNHPMGWSYQFGIHTSKRKSDYLFMESFNDTVYRVNYNEINPEYIVDFGDLKEEIDFYNLNRSTFPQNFKNIKGACFVCNFHEKNNLIYMTYYYKDVFKNCFYYKKEEKYFTGLLFNDISGYLGNMACMSKGLFYYYIDKNMIDIYMEKVNEGNYKFLLDYENKIRQLQNRITENRNPIIFEVKFKDHVNEK